MFERFEGYRMAVEDRRIGRAEVGEVEGIADAIDARVQWRHVGMIKVNVAVPFTSDGQDLADQSLRIERAIVTKDDKSAMRYGCHALIAR